ncbi:MAG: LysR substrate-binding domain-containing protein [Spongiibacteraceae bacterium]|jgi:LysR family nitrogen assimilation transcriptional regulator|nr:LysR substrate-binding domain-containing protein [Spongiibacteraceae bacterium]
MNLKRLEYFMRVAELGSFSQAALMLNIAQSALSRQVRALEEELGTRLLERTGRGVLVTEAGRRLLEHGTGILQQVERAREDMRGGELAGRVVVGIPPSIGRQLTLPLVAAFQQRLPHARLAIVEGLSTHISEWLATGRVDIGLVHNPDPLQGIATTPLLDEVLCLVSPGKPDGALPPLPLNALPQHALIVPDGAHTIRKLVEAQAALSGLKLNIAWEVASVPSIIDLVSAGYGHGVLSAEAVRVSARAAELTIRPLCDPQLTSVLCLAVSSQKRRTPLVAEAAALLKQLVAELHAVTAP